MAKSDIVFGSEFSPGSIKDIPALLELVKAHEPHRYVLQNAIDSRFFPRQTKSRDPRKTLGDNTILSLSHYGIVDIQDTDIATYHLTDFGNDLYAARADDQKLRDLMGRHILVDLNGLRVVEAIRILISSNTQLKKDTLAKLLREQGLHISVNGKHLNIIRQWMEFAGILNASQTRSDLWTPNEPRIQQLLGITTIDAERWSELDQPQYDFARAFALMGVDEANSNKVREMAESLYGTEFPEGGLPQSVLHRLQDVGLLTYKKVTGGQGAKPHLVYPTAKLKNAFLLPILKQLMHGMGRGYKKFASMPLEKILSDLDHQDRNVKGIALEALAFYICRRLDLSFKKWRLKQHGFEVDLVVEGKRLVFSRWQIQCKNTPTVSTEDLAKEVGVATALRSQVVLLATNGKIGSAVQKFARTVMENTALHVILLSGDQLRQIIADGANLTAILNQQAANAMAIKRVQLDDA